MNGTSAFTLVQIVTKRKTSDTLRNFIVTVMGKVNDKNVILSVTLMVIEVMTIMLLEIII